jgi:hypothetical protein
MNFIDSVKLEVVILARVIIIFHDTFKIIPRAIFLDGILINTFPAKDSSGIAIFLIFVPVLIYK